MPIDTQTPRSPGWWLARLMARLADQRARYDLLDDYYAGEAGIPIHASKACRDAYRRLMALSRTNFAELVVEAVRERMMLVGFRTAAAGDELGDAEALRILQANSLDADAALVQRASLVMGTAAVIVGGPDEEIGAPLITPEDPRQVIVECDPARRRKVVAALKVFTDDTYGADRAYLYLPGVVLRAARPTSLASAPDISGWEWDGGPERLPAPVVPVVPFLNRSALFGGATKGEFEPHLPVLDRINFSILSRVEVNTLQAFRQRAIQGDLPTHTAQGDEIDYNDIFAADPGALWQLPSTVSIWESGQVDLGPIRSAIRDDVQDLAAVTRTPLYYFTPDSANGSAEGAALAREGLVFKVHDRLVQASEAWESVMSLAFLFAGDSERSARGGLEAIWAPPERFSLNERAQAASLAITGGVPWRTVMTDIWQFSPVQVARMESERAADLMLQSLSLAPADAAAS